MFLWIATKYILNKMFDILKKTLYYFLNVNKNKL